tara:strand:- start:369 stop:788 length:420 start_codon:yes stop_codon:yes gene_type:complete
MFGSNYEQRIFKPEHNNIEKRLLKEVNHCIKRVLLESGHSPKEVWLAMTTQMPGSYVGSFGNFHRKKTSKHLYGAVERARASYAEEITTLKSSALLELLLSNKFVFGVFSTTDLQCIMYALEHNISRPTIDRIKKKLND